MIFYVTEKAYNQLIRFYNDLFRLGIHKYRKLKQINDKFIFSCDTVEEFEDFKARLWID